MLHSRHEKSLRCLNQTSIERNISKTSQKHLKREVFLVTSLRCLKYISKKMFFIWQLKTSLTYLKKDVYSFSAHLKNISWKYLWLFKNTPQKWFCADKIDAGPLQTLAINRSIMNISGLIFMLFVSLVWPTSHLAGLAWQQLSDLSSSCIIQWF